MLRNYLKIAWRNLAKNKAFSLINIVGLAVSMSVCLLILLIINDQYSYDQFHTYKDRIFRVHTVGRSDRSRPSATSPLPLGDALKQNYAGVEQTASLVRNIGGDVFYGEKIASGGGYFTDVALFRLFDFGLAQGDPATALQNPFSLVVSPELATQLFGAGNPLGKIVRFNDTGINPGGPETGERETEYGNFTITGVLKRPAGKTHLPFKLLASLSTLPALAQTKKLGYVANDWSNVWSSYTYVLLKQTSQKANLQSALNQIAGLRYKKSGSDQYDFVVEALADITPSDPIGNVTHLSIPKVVLLILSILGLIVMLSACLNYTNLSVARSLSRAKEVGVRKVSGATGRQIFGQFIAEAVLISLLSLVLAVGLLTFLSIAFSGLWLDQYLAISFAQNGRTLAWFVAFSVVVGVVAGLLPSLYMSAFNPVQILKNFVGTKLTKRLTLRKVLLVTQFCISLIFVTSATLLYSQLSHLLRTDYGFAKDNVVNIKLYKTENYQRFARSIAASKAVVGVSASAFIPATNTSMGTQVFKVENRQDSLSASFLDIDANFVGVWKLKLLAGKNLPELPDTTSERYVLVNEQLVKQFKYPSAFDAVGRNLLLDGHNVQIVGVVHDFQFRDLTRKIGPLLLRNRPETFGYANVRISGTDPAATVNYLAAQWRKVNPTTKFDYEFLDQQLLGLQLALTDIAKIIGFLAGLAVLISCLGLLGMAAFTAETRTKEIGVRKALGASVTQIALLLSRGYMQLLLLAILIATPVAYFLSNVWLNFFAYRISLGPGVFLISISIMLLISLLTVLSQTWRAARSNPINSSRSE